MRWIGWYPGDWVWMTLVALLVAAAGAAVAIATTGADGRRTRARRSSTHCPSVSVTMPPTTAVPSTDYEHAADGARADLARDDDRGAADHHDRPKPAAERQDRRGRHGENGWTVVLVSLPATKAGRQRAQAQAQKAVRAGLPDVGVLSSSQYTSLHPGYFVVFSGIFDTRAQADSTLNARPFGRLPRRLRAPDRAVGVSPGATGTRCLAPLRAVRSFTREKTRSRTL